LILDDSPLNVIIVIVIYMEIFINYAAGIIAGCSYITMAMPFDLIKTKLQLNKDISI